MWSTDPFSRRSFSKTKGKRGEHQLQLAVQATYMQVSVSVKNEVIVKPIT